VGVSAAQQHGAGASLPDSHTRAAEGGLTGASSPTSLSPS
jgi:hypothetical protein